MALTYATAVKTARMQAVVDQIGSGGKIKIGTTGMATTLATFTMVNPCGSVSGDTLTFDFDPDLETTGLADGSAAAAIITDSSDVTKISGLTVGTTGTNIVLDSVAIVTGQRVILQAGTIQHAT